MKWEIIKDESKVYWLELRGTDGFWEQKIGSKEKKTIWNYYAIAKWDGCIEFSTYVNGYGYNHKCEEDCQCCVESIHICSRGDSLIEALLELQKVATRYFQEHGHVEEWSDDK